MTAAVGAQISRLDYNNLRKLVNAVLGAGGTNPNTNASDPTFGYGQSLLSSDVSAGDIITEAQWDYLRLDINKAFTHQTGAPTPLPDVAGSINVGASNATSVRFSEIYQAYLAAATNIVTNRGIIAIGTQTPVEPTVVTTKTLTSAWAESVTLTGTVSFASAAAARSFFNSGGTINFTSSRTGGTSSPQNLALQNNSWTNFLNNKVGTFEFGKDQFYALTSGGLAPGADPVIVYTADAPYSNNYFRIYANCNVPSNSTGTATFISFKIQYVDLTVRQGYAADLIDGTLSCAITETKSNGVLTILSPVYSFGTMTSTGTVSNLLPSFALTSNLDSASEGQSVIFTLTTRNYPSGKSYLLELTGITDADVTPPQTVGIKTISTSGNDTLATATYTVNLKADAFTDPTESIVARLTVAADSYQEGSVLEKTVTIIDSSKTPTPSVSITTTTANVVAGEPDWGSYALVTVTNSGTRVLNISAVQINHGANLSDHQSDFPGNPTGNEVLWYTGSIAIGESGSFHVRFKGSVAGTQTATVTIISDGNDTPGGGPAPGSSKSANVTVIVAAASYGWSATPASITTSFASDGITPGETALTTVRLSNTTGNATITLGNPAVTITNVGSLTPVIVSDPSGQTIAPGAYKEFQVKFTNGLTAPSTTNPTITIDGGSAGTKIINATVTGTASLPGITVLTSSLVATSKKINEEATTSFTISNSGSATLNVTNIVISGQNSNSTYTISPSNLTIAKGAPPQTVTVTSKRSRIGTDPATITITSNAPNPNNSKTVSFTMTSTALTPTYSATMEGYSTITDVNVVAVGKRGTSFTNGFQGAEPNAKFYSYHDQQGKITGASAGQTVLQLFNASVAGTSSALPGGTTDAQGAVGGWNGTPNELQYWDVGLSKAWFFIPVGKLDNGTQQWMTLPGAGGGVYGYVQMEILPNITQTLTPAVIEVTNIENDNANQPIFNWSASNGYQNAPWDSNGPGNSNYGFSGTYTGVASTMNSGGSATFSDSQRWIYRPGVYTRIIRQTYKGTEYSSNSQSITVYSPAYYDSGLTTASGAAWGWDPSDGRRLMLDDACYVNNSQDVGNGQAYKFYRSVSLPAGSYTLKCCADDQIWVVLPNVDTTTTHGNLSTVGQRSFTLSTTTTLLIDWSYKNFGGGNWSTNPGWFTIQIFNSGGAKVWGTKQATARGY